MNKDKKAKHKWKEIVPQLEAMGVLTLADEDALVRYCKFYSVYRDMCEDVRENGTTCDTVDKDGNPIGTKVRPEMNLILKISEQMLKLAEHFGLTPATRARLKTPGTDGKSKDKKKTKNFIKTISRAG